MAVYTEVTDDALRAFLADYDLGSLLSFKGIAEGVENSNFLLRATRGTFILTLYEKRVDAADLPFFLGLLTHLSGKGLTCPQPVLNRAGSPLGRLADRPAALVTFLEGVWIKQPKVRHCVRPRRGAGAASRSRRRFCAAPTERPLAFGLAPPLRSGRRPCQ